jgi:hypothetical protein
MAAGRSGFRTLLTTERPRLPPLTQVAGERVGMTTCMLQAQVILLDWSLDGIGFASELGISPRLGITEVLSAAPPSRT